MTTEELRTYVTAGNAYFTIESTKWDKRYTYRVTKDKAYPHLRYYVYVLFGPENTKDYRFLGWFYTDSFLFMAHNSTNRQFKLFHHFLYFLYIENELPDTCVVHISKRCARCGRLLTTPESIEEGFGPKCAKIQEECKL